MAFGELSQFLPRAEGEKLNTEQARAEGLKRAEYLSSMDQFYESLEESQRQFDIRQELANRQFEWESEFQGEKLELEERLSEEGLRLQELEIKSQTDYQRGMLGIERDRLGIEEGRFTLEDKEQQYLQWLYGEQNRQSWQKLGLESRVIEEELGSTNLLPGRSGRFRSDWDRTPAGYGSKGNYGGTTYRGYSNPSNENSFWR